MLNLFVPVSPRRKLEHHDPEVQRNALFAFQRILMSKQQLNLAAKVVGA